jgi:hypothetical protein
MNYIELINNFWRLNKEYSFTAAETQLYFKLIDTCNVLGWKNPFSQSNLFICAECGMSEPTLIRTRNTLKNQGLLEFTSGKIKRQFTSYHILGLNNFSPSVTQSDTLSDTLSVTLCSKKSLDNIKQEKQNKTKEESNTNAEKINFENSNPPIEQFPFAGWQNDFSVYLKYLNNGINHLKEDKQWIMDREKFHPNIDIMLSLEKGYKDFWSTEAGWILKKKPKGSIKKPPEKINWKSTMNNSLTINQVYKPR